MQTTGQSQLNEGLESWEVWPVWALGLSNGANIALWYILSFARIQAPELPIRVLGYLQSALPLIVVIGGVSAAVSLDGVLIATIAGMRHGRKGIWSVLTIVGAALFSGAIAYAVHSGWLDKAPGLHVAQAVVLALYNLHLSQTKSLHSSELTARDENEGAKTIILADPLHRSVSGFTCRKCGVGEFATLADVRRHQLSGCLTVVPQRDSVETQMNGREV
jgi:hypothetical protein